MTTTLQKTEIKTTWTIPQIQDTVSLAMMRNMTASFKVVEKAGPQVLKDWYQAITANRVESLKAAGVKTPLELVTAMAEFETNVFGSKIKVYGDEKQASLEYEVCACFNAMQKCGMSQTELEHMGKNCAENTNHLAEAFGFTGEMKKGGQPGEPMATITFTRK
jgi:hypothetical protein